MSGRSAVSRLWEFLLPEVRAACGVRPAIGDGPTPQEVLGRLREGPAALFLESVRFAELSALHRIAVDILLDGILDFYGAMTAGGTEELEDELLTLTGQSDLWNGLNAEALMRIGGLWFHWTQAK